MMQRYALHPGVRGVEALAAAEIPRTEPFHVLVVTDRSAVVVFLSALPVKGAALFVDHVDARPMEIANSRALIARATVAVVDPASDPGGAIEICRELHRERPALPVAVVVCCSGGLNAWQMRKLMATGVRGIFSLHETGDGVRRALLSLARGETVVRLEARPDSASFFPFLVLTDGTGHPERAGQHSLDADVLSKLAHGLSDREIGAALHLSPFTVKHHIERLRDAVGARNRIALAAWAGRHGFP